MLLTEWPIMNKYLTKQAGWLLRPDCAPRSECARLGMMVERRAQF